MQDSKRCYSLDLIKIIATVLILFHHFQQVTGIRFRYITFWYGRFYCGRLVELFFMISGFLMVPYILRIEEGLTFGRFFFRRYLRLIPIVALGTACDLVIKVIDDPSFLTDRPIDRIVEFLSIALGLHGVYTSNETGFSNPMWYISVLLWCYIIFYVLFAIIRKLPAMKTVYGYFLPCVVILLGLIVIFGGYNYPFINKHVGRGCVSFFAGLIVGYFLSRHKIPNKWIPILLTLLVGSFVLIYPYPMLSYSLKNILYMVCLCYTLLIMTSQTSPVIDITKHKVLAPLAKISFHAYCFHVAVYDLLVIIMSRSDIGNIAVSNGALTMICTVMIVFVLSCLTYNLIEKPLSKALTDKGY